MSKLLICDESGYRPIRTSLKYGFLDIKTVTNQLNDADIIFCVTNKSVASGDFGHAETPSLFDFKVTLLVIG